MNEKAREQRLRRLADRHGYILRKDRSRTWSPHSQGGWMIVDPQFNIPVWGWDYDLDLDDLEAWFTEP